jgi:hypothetical protein
MIAVICPDCRTESNAETNAEVCPACGFRFMERRTLPPARAPRSTGMTIMLLAGCAGTLFLIGLAFL